MNRDSRYRTQDDSDHYLKMPYDERRLDLVDTDDQLGFIKKVYGILFFQLAITASITVLTYLNQDVKQTLLTHSWIILFAVITSIVISCCMFCITSISRTVPINYILMAVFTACESLIVAYICAVVSNPQIVMAAALMTAGMVLALTVYACTTSTDFTVFGALGFLLGSIFLLLGLFSFLFGPKMHFVYCSLGVLLFGFYLIIDTQMIVGKDKYQLDKDDYILGAMILYLDIINIFLYMIQILTSLCNQE